MKISELSRRSGVPLPSIKFYIREGLLPPGTKLGRNQADYDEAHLERLALIRSLRDDAGIPIETIARALRAADEAKSAFVIEAVDRLARPTGVSVDTDSELYKRAERAILRVARARGWKAKRSDVSVRDAARALAVIRKSFPTEDEASLMTYAEIAERIARHELPDGAPAVGAYAAQSSSAGPRETLLRFGVLGTVLFEPFLLALRRMAHVARARQMLGSRAGSARKS